MSNESIGLASRDRTVRHIAQAARDSLKRNYDIDNGEIVDNLLRVIGMHPDMFDAVRMDSVIISERLNDVSIDGNANKSEKTIAGIDQETAAPSNKVKGHDALYREMVELFGHEEAQRLTGEMYTLSLGISDSTKLRIPYCFSIDASKLIYEGRPFGQLPSLPVQNLRGYVSCLTETIHQLSSHLAGAIAVGSFFLDVAHLCMYKHKYTLHQLRHNKKIRKEITNSFQHFVHSVNMLSRNSVESPFTNISVNDKVKLAKMLSEMEHMFPYEGISQGIAGDIFGGIKRTVYRQKKQEYYDKYIIDYIYELQNIYLDFFDKGAPSLNGAPYRFPVTTLCLSKHKNQDDKWEVSDMESLKNFAKREIYRYNIFASEGSKFASCCRLINDEELMDDYASQSNSFGAGGAISLGSHRVVTINFPRIAMEANNEQEFFDILKKRIEDSGSILKAHKQLIKNLSDAGLHMFITNGWLRLDRMFSTFGIIGIYECSEIFREKFGNGRDIEGIILKFMNDEVRRVSRELGIAGNIEQIPGESFAVRFADADRMIFGEETFGKYIKAPLYSNQFAPLWNDVDIWERLTIDGKYNGLITGGGIVHATIGAKVTFKQAMNIILFAVSCGCEHFALNAIYSECEHGHITFGKSSQCPECGGKVVDYLTRIVGFFVRVSDFNKPRREWEFPRRKADSSLNDVA